MKTMIGVPCMDMVQTRFMTSLLGMRRTGEIHFNFKLNSLIYDSRNQIAADAIESGADRVLWLDSDVSFAPDLMERLTARMDEGRDFVTGLYFRRIGKAEPVLYERIDPPEEDPEDGLMKTTVHPAMGFTDEGEVFRVDGCGFGACMMKTDLLKQVWDKFGPPFSPYAWAGEDISFCYRLKLLGIPVWCDRTIAIGHLGVMEYNEKTFLRDRATEQKRVGK